MIDHQMTTAQWNQRRHYINALVANVYNNISAADLYEDEWKLRRDATEVVDAKLFNRTVSPSNMVAGL